MIKAVIFDMDGLLIDSEAFWQEEERRIFNELGVPVTPELQRDTYGLGTYELVKHWYHLKPWDSRSFQEVVDDIYSSVASRIVKEGKAKHGVDYIFDFFKDKNLDIALASASPMDIIDKAIDKLGIRKNFKVIHSCQFEEYEKPHPAVYISTAKKLGVEPARCLVFEDSFVGLLAAKSARMKTVSIPDPAHAHEPKYCIADIRLNNLKEFKQQHFDLLNNLN